MKKALFIIGLIGLCATAYSQPYSDRWFTQPITDEDGDTIRTSQVSVSSSVATLILPALTDRTVRKRTIHNTGSFTVYIGTGTTGRELTTIGYDLTPSTGTNSVYRTANQGSIYGLSAGGSSISVTVIEEYNAAK